MLAAVDIEYLEGYELIKHLPFDPMIKRTEGTVREKKTGKVFRTSKGAPHIILKLVNDPSLNDKVEEEITKFGEAG